MNELLNLLNQITNSGDQTYSFNGRNLSVSVQGWVRLEDLLLQNEVVYDLEQEVIRVNIEKIENVYLNKVDFFRRYSPIDEFQDSLIYLINEGEEVIEKARNEQFSEEKSFFFNFHYYKLLITLFSNTPTFCDYHKDTYYKLILMEREGAILMGYDPMDNRVEELNDLEPEYTRLIRAFSTTEFQKFFKETVLLSIKRIPVHDRFFEMIKVLGVTIDHTERDYINYLQRFSFKEIQSQFKEERKKYFQELENSLDLINKQILAFPLTFSASAFAGYQVKDKPLILILIFIAYSLYTIVAWRTLSIAKSNLNNVKEDVNLESTSIQNLNNAAFVTFEPDFKKIFDKIKQLEGLVCWLRGILVSLIFLFIIYFLFESISAEYVDWLKSILTK
jgi:hypothetical protein